MCAIRGGSVSLMKTFVSSLRRSLTSALSAVAGPATVPVVGVQHGDVATLVLQVHLLLQLLQCLVRTHVGVGELCSRGETEDTTDVGDPEHRFRFDLHPRSMALKYVVQRM